jgi:hypothetical protein
MDSTLNTTPVAHSLPQADTPVRRPDPEIDPRREAHEVVEEITADALLVPGEYLDQVRVPGGGE